MNANILRLIFSKRHGMLVAVAEITASQGKGSGAGAASGTSGVLGASVGLHSASSALQSVGNNDPPEVEGFGFSLKSLGVSFALAFTAQSLVIAQTLPSGGVVIGGSTSATITTPSASSMVINQESQSAIINWQSFGIGTGASVQFVQPNAASSILNRVQGSGVSQIDGMLSANGRVFIANPNGIVFGSGAYVDVGSLLATTKDISDTNFSAGNYKLTSNGGNASVINNGALRANSGFVVLMSDQVRNAGSISGERIVLGAGNSATLALSNGQVVNINIDVPTAQALVENTGTLSADGGAVILSARGNNAVLDSVINVQGLVSARQGTVLIDGGSNGVAQINGGTVDVSGTGAGQSGGTVVLQGQRVGLLNGSTIDARGAVKGGTVIVGGDNLGKAPVSVTLSEQMVIDGSSKIDASGVGMGDGGFVETSGRTVTIIGNVFASGGPGLAANVSSGNGTISVNGNSTASANDTNGAGSGYSGNTTISSNTNSTNNANASTATTSNTSTPTTTTSNVAANISTGTRLAGQWLIDPSDITISVSGTPAGGVGGGPIFQTNSPSGSVANGTISNSLSTGTNITITTAGSGNGNGNITASNVNITNSGTNNTVLTLLANGSINITGSNITGSNTGTLAVNLQADQDNTGDGYIRVVNSSINTNGGMLTIRANTSGAAAGGASLIIQDSNITATGAGSNITADITTTTGSKNAINISGTTTVIANNINGTTNGIGSGIYFGTGNFTLGGNFTGTSLNGIGVWFNGAGTTTLNATNVNAFNILGVHTATTSITGSTLNGTEITRALIINNQGDLNVSLAGVTNDTGNGRGLSVRGGNLTIVNNGTSGSINVAGYANVSSREGLSVSGSIDVKNSSSSNVTITGQSSIYSAISTSVEINLNNSGSGVLMMNGSSTAQTLGAASIQAGTNFTASNSGVGNLSVGGSSNSTLLNNQFNGISTGTLTINNSAAGNLIFAGTSANGNGINTSGAINVNNSGNGNLTIAGTSNSTTNTTVSGIQSIGNVTIAQSGMGTTSINGTALAGQGLKFNSNLAITNSNIGNITLAGVSNENNAINLVANVAIFNVNTGNITVTGQSNAGAGLNINSGVTVNVSGNVTLNGQSVNGTGISTNSASAILNSGNGTLTLNGTVNGAGTTAVLLGGTLTGTGTGDAKQVILGDKNITLNGTIKSAGTGGIVVNSSAGNITLNNGINTTQGNITLAAGSANAIGNTAGDVIRGAAVNGSIAAGAGTVIIYSGTPNTSNANTSIFQGLVAGATSATTNKAYSTNSTSGVGAVNSSAKLNAFYRIQPNITLNGTNQTKIYDGTNAANNSAYTLVSGSLLDGDVLGATSATIIYNTTHAGSSLAVGFSNATGNITGGSLIGTQSAASLGYQFTTNNATGVISAANVTVTANTDNRVYNGTNVSAVNATVSGLLTGENLSGINQTYNTSNVGTGLILTAGNATGVIGGTAGSLLSDYNISYVSNTTGVITALSTPPIVVAPITTSALTPTPVPVLTPAPAPLSVTKLTKPSPLDMGRINTMSKDVSERGIIGSSDRSNQLVKTDDATKTTIRRELHIGNTLTVGVTKQLRSTYECDPANVMHLPDGVQKLETQCGNIQKR